MASLDDRACQSLVNLVDLAIKIRVDLVIFAGDLFDTNRVDDNLVSFVVEQLQRLTVYISILPRNHDCLTPDSVFNRANLWQNCADIRVFKAARGEVFDLPSLGVSLWGRPINSYERNIRPLAGIPEPQGNRQWNIAVAHGYYVGAEPPLLPSYNITQEEIITLARDYIALGYVTTFTCVCNESVKAYYCGSPLVSGTVNVVDFDEEKGVQVSRHCL